MSRILILATAGLLLAPGLFANPLPDQWGSFRKIGPAPALELPEGIAGEFGFVSSDAAQYAGKGRRISVSALRLKDATGALAAWDWLRPVSARRCSATSQCAVNNKTTLIRKANYVLAFEGGTPVAPEIEQLAATLPNIVESQIPSMLGFVPVQDLVPNSARYLLGPKSLAAVAPEIGDVDAGFNAGTEAHYTAYRLKNSVARLVLLDYPTPSMARAGTIRFKAVSGAQVKRSGVLVAVILPGATEGQAQAILDQIRYQAKILWNETPPPNPVPKLYSLLINIIIISVVLSGLALSAGIVYGLIRIYRRRYGTLEADEAMTTLRLTRD